jgi:hypothetical protein
VIFGLNTNLSTILEISKLLSEKFVKNEAWGLEIIIEIWCASFSEALNVAYTSLVEGSAFKSLTHKTGEYPAFFYAVDDKFRTLGTRVCNYECSED